MSDWIANAGSLPGRCKGKRVKVRLRGRGDEPVEAKDYGSTTAPPGWSASTTRWELTGDLFDVIEYQVL